MTDQLIDPLDSDEPWPPVRPMVVIGSMFEGRELYTFCPPGTSLEMAIEVHLAPEWTDARKLDAKEIFERFGIPE